MIERWALLAIGAMISVALAQILIKAVVKEIDYGTAVIVMHLAALATVVAIFGIGKMNGLQVTYTTRSIYYIALSGILIGIVNLFIFIAFIGGPVSRVSPIVGLAPAILVFAGYFMFNETITLKTGVGVILAISAIMLLST